MAYIHSKGIAHLDLKTTNILLTTDKRSTVIADFGISQARAGFGSMAPAAGTGMNPVFDSGGGMEMSPMGPPMGSPMGSSMGSPAPSSALLALTPQYCAPERLLRKDLSFEDLLATDVYTYGKRGCLWNVSGWGALPDCT